METNKYYTPEPEEFYVGFEYEINMTSAFPNTEKEIWIKMSITEDNRHSNMDRISCLNTVRVKYLDKEDIESLGWAFISEKTNSGFDLKSFHLMYWTTNDFPTINISQRVGDRTLTKFEGTIKNKSELKKLMQQLGI